MILKDYVLLSDSLAVLLQPSWEQCAAVCEHKRRCIAWTYVTMDLRCHLKGRLELPVKELGQGYVSGLRSRNIACTEAS